MSAFAAALDEMVTNGWVPGLVAAVGQRDDIEVIVRGDTAVGGRPMAQDSLFRIASLTKPMMAALALTFVADSTLVLDEPIGELLPELAEPVVLRSMSSPLDDTVPVEHPITLRHLLTSTNGHGLASDFSLPVVQLLMERLGQGPPQPQSIVAPDEWMARLGQIPLLHQPGEAFTYNTAFDILGVLLARASSMSLPEVLQQRLLDPLGMTDTGFSFASETDDRRTTYYQQADDELVELDAPDGQWASVPAFPSGAGGLVSTAADVTAFQQMLLSGGGGVLPAELVAEMMSGQLPAHVRETDTAFLDGQTWGFGGSVDITEERPWNVSGRYGWVGGTGTSAYVSPTDGSVAVLLTQVELDGPSGSRVIEGFWAAAADHLGHDGHTVPDTV